MVGLEGVFGIIFIFMWMMLFSFVKCPSADMCNLGGFLEDPVSGVK
jgi:hypothetical protein